MTIEEAITAYKTLSPDIFQKKWWTQNQPMKYFGAEVQQYWFEGKNLKDAVQRLLRDMKLDPGLKLWEADNPSCKVYVCMNATRSAWKADEPVSVWYALSVRFRLIPNYSARTSHGWLVIEIMIAVSGKQSEPYRRHLCFLSR